MPNINPLADVQSQKIGEGTNIWQYCVILPNAEIGEGCNICSHVLIENDVVIGNNVIIKSGVQIWDGIHIEDEVFIGPNVTFTNDLVPRSKHHSLNWKKDTNRWRRTVIEKGVAIGANTTVLAGVVIGKHSLIGAGSVVTKDIPCYSLYFGNPAKHKGYITEKGVLLNLNLLSENGDQYFFNDNKLELR